MVSILEDVKEIKAQKWGTLNTASSPFKLPEGHSPNHQNVWVDEKPGSVVTSKGYIKLGTLPSNLPPTFGIEFFKSSDGSSRIVVSDGQNVYQTTDYVNYSTITTGLSPFFQLRGKVIRDKLWLTNGSDSVMTWDGTALVTLDGSGSTPDVPKGKFIEYHDERVFMYGIDGDLSASRFTALTDTAGTEITPDDADAWPTDNEIQISEGDADIGTGIFIYRGYLYFSKQYSFWRLVGYDEYTYSRVKTRSSTGTRFQESVAIKDNLVHFIGVDGFYVFDGEESKRISDPIDPASPDAGVFAFRNLQQPLLNNQFWNISTTGDFATGTVPRNFDTSNDTLSLKADDSQADFNAGTHTNTTADDNPGNLQLAIVDSGNPGNIISTNKTAFLVEGANIPHYGIPAYITDGNQNNNAGFKVTGNNLSVSWRIDLGSTQRIGRAIIRQYYSESTFGGAPFVSAAYIRGSNDATNWTILGPVVGPGYTGAINHFSIITGNVEPLLLVVEAQDFTIDFSTANFRYVEFFLTSNSSLATAHVIKELEVYLAGYHPSGQFLSLPINFGTAPGNYGSLAATITTNGEAYQFFTQSSSDSVTWDPEVNVSNGGVIGSTLKQYLRWGVNLASSTGVSTPVIDKVYVGGTYISAIHDTGGNIFAWAAFQMDQNKAGQTITAYYRAATSSVGVLLKPWTAIIPGAVPGAATTDTFIQIKVELSTASSTNQPSIGSFTVNWILSSGAGTNTLQNVASIVILNRYWLSAATRGADANDIVIVLGKNTANSPFHQKDFEFLSFFRFQDYYVAGSSVDGSLYRLESGYSKAGLPMDSFYETADFSLDNFQFNGLELNVSCERSGPYTLSVGWSMDSGLVYNERTIDLTRESGQALNFTKQLNINFMSDSVRFRVRINETDQPFSVDELQCYYRPSLQRGTLISQ